MSLHTVSLSHTHTVSMRFYSAVGYLLRSIGRVGRGFLGEKEVVEEEERKRERWQLGYYCWGYEPVGCLLG